MFACLILLINLLQLRVVRIFRSTLEDLNERRSMHSLNSLRNPRNGLNTHTANTILLNASGAAEHGIFTHNQPGSNKPSHLLAEMLYIDEDPQVSAPIPQTAGGH